jgi:hypothetical protein
MNHSIRARSVGASLRGRPNLALTQDSFATLARASVISKEMSCENLGRPRKDAPTILKELDW